MSDFVLLVGFFIITMAAVGVGELIWGMIMMTYSPRSQHALDRWLKRMKAFGAQNISQRLTPDQFDRETLLSLVRYERRMRGTVLAGMGGGIFIGAIATIGVANAFYQFYATSGNPPIPTIMELLYPIMGLGAILGIGVSAALVATVGAQSPRPSLSKSVRRIRNFRSPWFLLVNCLVFLLSAILPVLFITHTAPRSLYVDTFYGQQPLVGLLIMASALVGATILLAEIVSRLITRYPMPAADLPPDVEAQLLESLPAFAISQTWGYFTVMSVLLLSGSEALSDPLFSLMLLTPVFAISYMLVYIIHFSAHLGNAWTPMARAIALVAKPRENEQDE